MEEFVKMEAQKVEKAFSNMTDAVEVAFKSGLCKGLRQTVGRAKAICRLMKASNEDNYDYTQVLPADTVATLKDIVRVASTYASHKVATEDLDVVIYAITTLGEN